MWDNIFGAWLYSFENKSWIVVSQEKILCWIFSDLSRPSTWYLKLNCAFLLTTFIQCFEHAECIAIDIFNLLCWALSDGIHRDGSLDRVDDVKTPHTHTFSSTKLLTRVTVDDKLVLVNPFWWNNHLFIVFAVLGWFEQRASLTVNIDLSDVTNKYYTELYRPC